MKPFSIIIPILLVILSGSCQKEEEPVDIKPTVKKYYNGVVIRGDYQQPSGSSSLTQISNPNTVILKPENGMNLKSGKGESDYSILVEGLNGIINQIKTYGGDSIKFTNVAAVLPINNKYVLLKGDGVEYPPSPLSNIKVNMSFGIYNDITLLDSISIDSLSNDNTYIHRYINSLNNLRDTIRIYNLIDTVLVDGKEFVKYYDTITVKVNKIVQSSNLTNILYNVETGKYYNLNEKFQLLTGHLTPSRNNPLSVSDDGTKFYIYTGASTNSPYILEVNLSGDTPQTKEKYSHYYDGSHSSSLGAAWLLGNEIVFRDLWGGDRYISISEDGKTDTLKVIDFAINSFLDGVYGTDTSLLFFTQRHNADWTMTWDTVDVWNVKLVNGSFNVKNINTYELPEPFAETTSWVGMDRQYTYSFSDDNGDKYFYAIGTQVNGEQIVGKNIINVFSPRNKTYFSYRINNFKDFTYSFSNTYFQVSMVEKIDNYFLIYNANNELFKVDMTDLNNLTAVPLTNMSGIRIKSMTADNNKLLVFFGFDTNKNKYVSGKIDVNGTITNLIESDIDNSKVLVTSLKLK